MLILGIDTATPWGTMALCDERQVIFEVSLEKLKGGGEFLLAFLQELMLETGRDCHEIQLIAAGTGPGSYTGIRVGLAAAAGLAEGLNIPVFGINTLKIIAENCRLASSWIAPAINARHGEVYGALYHSIDGGLKEVMPPTAIKAQAFADLLSKYSEIMMCGDGSKEYSNIWDGYNNIRIAPYFWDRPMAVMAAQIALREWERAETSAQPIEPSYLKRVEAEVRLEEKGWNEKSLSTQ